MGGAKASVGHSEAASGVVGLLKVERLPGGVVEAIFDALDEDLSGAILFEEVWARASTRQLDPNRAAAEPRRDGCAHACTCMQRVCCVL